VLSLTDDPRAVGIVLEYGEAEGGHERMFPQARVEASREEPQAPPWDGSPTATETCVQRSGQSRARPYGQMDRAPTAWRVGWEAWSPGAMRVCQRVSQRNA
jgi:hypothetical protein